MQNGENVVEQYKQQFEKICAEADTRLIKYPLFARVHETTNIRPAYVSLGVIVFVLLLLLFGLGSSALTNLICFIYPTYASFSALRSNDVSDYKQWLTYWVIFAFFTVVESITDALMDWIPFYFLAKVLFLCWCYFPQTRGAERLNVIVIEPMMGKVEDAVAAFTNTKPATPKTAAEEVKQDIQQTYQTIKQKMNTGFATLSKKTMSDIQGQSAPNPAVNPEKVD